jgi:hypothetical protein
MSHEDPASELRVPNPEITFLSMPFPQVRHFLPLESSPTRCNLCDLSLQLVHSYS